MGEFDFGTSIGDLHVAKASFGLADHHQIAYAFAFVFGVITGRRPRFDRPATEADLASFKEGEMELTERTEVPVVSKESRVVEEVRGGKAVKEREETVKGTVKKTEVDVEENATETSHR